MKNESEQNLLFYRICFILVDAVRVYTLSYISWKWCVHNLFPPSSTRGATVPKQAFFGKQTVKAIGTVDRFLASSASFACLENEEKKSNPRKMWKHRQGFPCMCAMYEAHWDRVANRGLQNDKCAKSVKFPEVPTVRPLYRNIYIKTCQN